MNGLGLFTLGSPIVYPPSNHEGPRLEAAALMAKAEHSVSAFTIVGIALASALVPLNSTMIAVALPTLSEEFDIARGDAAVLVTIYLAAMLVYQAGRLMGFS